VAERTSRTAAAAYSNVRSTTLALTAPLEIDDYGVQPMDDASPPKWHLAHTTWFFEVFVLEPFAAGYRSPDPAYRSLFNSYYDGVGDRHPRERRGHLSRPTLAEVLSDAKAPANRCATLTAPTVRTTKR